MLVLLFILQNYYKWIRASVLVLLLLSRNVGVTVCFAVIVNEYECHCWCYCYFFSEFERLCQFRCRGMCVCHCWCYYYYERMWVLQLVLLSLLRNVKGTWVSLLVVLLLLRNVSVNVDVITVKKSVRFTVGVTRIAKECEYSTSCSGIGWLLFLLPLYPWNMDVAVTFEKCWCHS